MTGSDRFGSFPTRDLPPRQAKIALGLAVAVHLATLLMALLSPYLPSSKPVLPEVCTIDLISVAEPPGEPTAMPQTAPAAAPAPAAPEEVVPAPPPSPPKTVKQPEPSPPAPMPPPKAAPTPKAAPAPKATPAPASEPAVSLRPIKPKTQQDLKAVESLRQKLHAQQQAASAQQEAEKAKQQADKAVGNALAAIRQNIHGQPRPAAATGSSAGNATAPTAAAGVPSGGRVAEEEAVKRYRAAVSKRIKQHFVLPDLKNWQPTLQADLVIEIRSDGTVSRNFFERKSENIFFNQAVSKALTEAAPLPPFPPELKESRIEVFLRFRPGDLM